MLKDFTKSISAVNPQIIALRLADVRWGQALLKAVTILDAAWGKWEYLPAEQELDFEDPTKLGEYNIAMKEFEPATEETFALKQQIPRKEVGK